LFGQKRDLVFKGKDEQATQILCEVIQKLHMNKMVSGTYPSLEDLGKGFQEYFKSGDRQISPDLVSEAESIYKNLIKTQGDKILLHGDLHHDNVLYDETRGWLAIDPKGYVGEPTYEVGAFLRNPLNLPNLYQDPSQLNRRLDIIGKNLGFNRERVLAWAFSQAVLAGIWCVEDGGSPDRMIGLANIFLKTL
jgi:streptomycin 6-kinase